MREDENWGGKSGKESFGDICNSIQKSIKNIKDLLDTFIDENNEKRILIMKLNICDDIKKIICKYALYS